MLFILYHAKIVNTVNFQPIFEIPNPRSELKHLKNFSTSTIAEAQPLNDSNPNRMKSILFEINGHLAVKMISTFRQCNSYIDVGHI